MVSRRHGAPRSRSGLRWIFRVALVAGSAGITAVTLELGLALLAPVPHAMEVTRYFVPDPYTGYRLAPDTGETNSLGHRDDPTSVEKDPAVFRILVLGDSFSAGAGVEREQAYPQVLESLLTRAAGVPVEVVNSGVGGWQPFQYAQYYEHYGRDFSPDLVLVGFFVGNDAFAGATEVTQLRSAVGGRRVSREAAARPTIRAQVWLYQNSHLARLIWRRDAARDFSRASCDDFSSSYLRIQRHRMSNYLRRDESREALAHASLAASLRIQELTRRDGALLLVALLPDETQINASLQEILLRDDDPARFDFDMPQSLLADSFALHDIPTLDLLPAFRRDPRCLYLNHTHWTSAGHVFAASLIAEAVLEMGVIPSRVTGASSSRR